MRRLLTQIGAMLTLSSVPAVAHVEVGGAGGALVALTEEGAGGMPSLDVRVTAPLTRRLAIGGRTTFGVSMPVGRLR